MINKISNNNLFKNMLTLISGSVLAQVITFVLSPILTRIYGPEEFGLFSIYSSVLLILISISSLRMETTIVIAKDDSEAINMTYISLLICFTISTLLLLLIVLFFDDFASLVNIEKGFAYIFYFLPLSVLFNGINTSFIHWKNRLGDYNRIAKLGVARATLVGVSQITLGGPAALKTGLVFGQIIGMFFNSIRLTISSIKDISKRKHIVKISDVKRQIIKFKHFPLYGAPQVFLNATTRNLPPVVLAMFFGPGVVGLYALSYKMLQIPISLVSEALRKVLLKEISDMNNENRPLVKIVFKFSLIIIIIATILLVPLALNGEKLFTFVFGDGWEGAGQYASLLIFWLIFKLANVPSIVALQVIAKQKFLLIFEVFFSICSIAALILTGVFTADPYWTIFSFSIVSAVFYILLIIITIAILNRNTVEIMHKEV